MLLTRRLAVCEQTFSRLVGREATLRRRCIGTWRGSFESVAPRNEGGIVDRIDDGTFEMRHHLHIVVVFHVVAFDDGDFPIDDHEFRMEGSEQRLVEADDL